MNTSFDNKARFPLFNRLREDHDVNVYIGEQNKSMKALHYTEHSFPHVGLVAARTANILDALGRDDRTIDLAMSAAWLHDIGNIVNRSEHSQSGAIMAFHILSRMGVPAEDIAPIICAIGNHDEGNGVPVSDIAAAVIIADKSDVRRNRVQEDSDKDFDIHDRVNYSVTSSNLIIDECQKTITLELTLDNNYSEIGEYFQIFMPRMLLCKTAAGHLGLDFDLYMNGQKLM